MEIHKQTGEMISSTLNNIAMSLSRLHVSFVNLQSELKMDKVSCLAKYNKITSLEDLVIKIWYEPNDVSATEEIIKNKNLEIATLRKQLKLPATEDTMTKDIAEGEAKKADMMKLIIDQNI